MEAEKLAQVEENPSTFFRVQNSDLLPLWSPTHALPPLLIARMVFPPWDLPSSLPPLGKALSSSLCAMAGVQEISLLAVPAALRRQEDPSFGLLKCRGSPFGLVGGSLQQDLHRPEVREPGALFITWPCPPPGCGVPEPRGPLRTPGTGLSSAPPVCLQRPLS